jgi:hypothetical protein
MHSFLSGALLNPTTYLTSDLHWQICGVPRSPNFNVETREL